MGEKNNNTMKLPLVPLRGLVIFPKMSLHFDAGRDKTIKALEEAMNREQLVFLSAQMDITTEVPTQDSIYSVGTMSKIKQMVKLPGGSLRVLVEGICRGKVINMIDNDNYMEVEVNLVESNKYDEVKNEALYRNMLNCFEDYSKVNKKISPQVMLSIMAIEEPGELADTIASNIYMKREEKQAILECFDIEERIEKLSATLLNETDILKVEANIENRVRKNMDKVQREYHLKEQLKAIRSELGYGDGDKDDIEEYKEKINASKMSDEARKKALKELDRLAKTSQSTPESAVIRNYLDLILEIPWDASTKDNFDLDNARIILDEQHYGLKKIKERVIEFLAVKKLKNDMEGPILCLVGPPGVGKTSIARSIAEALDRKFVRMSLGGVRDEAEIRGHRKTYVGAMPGRIISSINRVKSNNPVFLLDEIDKMSSDFRGDAVSAMLEILDYEQNVNFRDNYLEVPFDLSKFLFIATANNIETIPAPLRDRMEIINLSSYTVEEKFNIAVNHLIPKQLEKHGISPSKVKIEDDVVYAMIEHYTREAGVRNLERQMAAVSRKIAVVFANTKKKSIKIKPSDIEKYLGVKKYESDQMAQCDEIGLVKGLAWTSVGGDTLDIEVAALRGSGKVELTGHLGNVMKESAMAAISYIRSKSKELGLEEDFYKSYDIHVHVPEGAVPKDGPSAGITIATAIISALKNLPVKRDIAMTGEITLRGRVLPIGGLKEKSIAAYRAGIRTVICPKDNKKDLEEIPDSVKDQMKFILVSHIDEVIEKAIITDEKRTEKVGEAM